MNVYLIAGSKTKKANIKYLDKYRHFRDIMSISRSPSVPTQTREIQITGKVLEQRGDFIQSKAVGQLLTLDKLPKFLSTGGMEELEKTEPYKQYGYVCFYLYTVGTEMHGRYKFNPKAQTLQEMFKPVSEKEYDNLPLRETARFWPGDSPLVVGLSSNWRAGGRLIIQPSCYELSDVAPVVVIGLSEKPKMEITSIMREDAK
jgi:hypothetical protein